MTSITTFGILALTGLANGHGYLTVPKSRVGLGFEVIAHLDSEYPASDADKQAGTDTCPECTIQEPVSLWPDLDASASNGAVTTMGDHGGMFAYRICQNQELVDKFLDPEYLPINEEKQAAEDCFEEG
ncbi:hypothetical protein DL771_003052 [Monosporascus sp. 5C6A]|nr:hypothetical protein DL771_003052 [Monosporascus sp. 5C6A]